MKGGSESVKDEGNDMGYDVGTESEIMNDERGWYDDGAKGEMVGPEYDVETATEVGDNTYCTHDNKGDDGAQRGVKYLVNVGNCRNEGSKIERAALSMSSIKHSYACVTRW
jgi:hypothetical protein